MTLEEQVARAIVERSATAGRDAGSHLRSQPLDPGASRDLAQTAIDEVLEAAANPTAAAVDAALAATDFQINPTSREWMRRALVAYVRSMKGDA